MPAIIRTIELTEWQAAAGRAIFTPLQQHWGYGAAANDLGARVSRLGIYDGEQLIGLAQLTHKKIAKLLPLSLCMRGPLWLGDVSGTMKSNAYRLLRKRYFYSLWMPEADDVAALTAASGRCVMTGYHTVLLDLSQSEETLRAQLDGKWRNRLVAAEATKLNIKKLKNQTDYGFALEAEAKQSAAKHYAALHPAFVPLYQFQMGDDAVLALSAKRKNDDLAAVICLIHGHCATYHIGWSSEEGKKLSAHNLLLWEAMCELKKRGIRWLDLGGLNTDDAPGIARFKISTGGRVISLPGTFF